MAITLDLTLNGITIPGITTFTRIFGTKKSDGVGLSTLEVNSNILAPWNRQRPFIAGEAATTGTVEANATVAITGGASVTLGAGAFVGVSVTLVNTTAAYVQLITSAITGYILPYQIMTVLWDGTAWRVDDGDAPGTIKPVSFPIDSTHYVPYGFLDHQGYTVSRTGLAYKRLWTVYNVFSLQAVTCTTATPALFTKASHGFTGGETIRLFTTGALTGATLSSDYFVEYVSASTFYLLTLEGGSSRLAITAQSGTHTYQQSLYGLGDGSTTFDTPDYRQCALVAAGMGTTHNMASVDPFSLGQFKDDRGQQLTGSLNSATGSEFQSPVGVFTSPTGACYRRTGGDASTNIPTLFFDSANSPNARVGATTRTKQQGANYLIKL